MKKDDLIAHCEQAEAIVASWPKWKRLVVEEALINSPYRREYRQRMAAFPEVAINPETGLTEPARFMRGHYGPKSHGVQFETTEKIFPMDGVKLVEDKATQSTPMPTTIVEDYTAYETQVLDAMCQRIHEHNVEAGWWDQMENSLVVPTKLALIMSEVVEALEGHRRGLMDDKLTDETMTGVELADVLIRVFDLCGFMNIKVGTLLAKKAAYNATRADHKPENRAKTGGKKY
jgi:NTP pyrophosphatase (non-canonical NTP hydrolase)